MKILLTGKNGQVGWELNHSLSKLGTIFALGRDQMDFSKPETLGPVIQKVRPDIIINAAAYTAVDNGAPVDQSKISDFTGHRVHSAVEEFCKLRPSVDISVSAPTSTKEIVIK